MNIVLASGYLFPQKIGPINYFRGVTAHLEAAGHQVLPADVPPLASCDDRAKKLAAAIEDKFKKSPVHIIAHSMGGLDSRMAIGKNYNGLGEPGRVISLTTLSTPHLGSPVADLLVGDESDSNNFRGGVLDVVQKLGIDTRALRDLTAKAVKAIPNIVETNKNIKYFSYAAAGHANPPPTSAALAVPYQFIKLTRNEDNDGVVTVPSAKYGDFQGIWPCDHVEMVGYDIDTLLAPPVLGALKDFFSRTFGLGSPEFKHLAKFDEIVAALQRIDGNQPK